MTRNIEVTEASVGGGAKRFKTLAVSDTGGTLDASDLSNGVTGSGAVVLATSPTLVTPVLGAATCTTLNTCTLPASGTLARTIETSMPSLTTISSGITGALVKATSGVLAASNVKETAHALQFTTTGSSTLTVPTAGTLIADSVVTLGSLTTVSSAVTGGLVKGTAGALSISNYAEPTAPLSGTLGLSFTTMSVNAASVAALEFAPLGCTSISCSWMTGFTVTGQTVAVPYWLLP